METEPVKTWYALYTRPRWEKKVHQNLTEAGIEAFLPLLRTQKQWSDRKKWVEEPLFRSYIFVHIELKDYYRAVNANGVVKYVTFEGKAASIPEKQISLVKELLAMEIEIEVIDEALQPGDPVIIKYGALKDIEGELVDFRSRKMVAIRIAHISGALMVSIPLAYIRKKN